MSSCGSEIYSLHINCGGKVVKINNTIYESDTEKRGASPYYNAGNWAFSSTGYFLDDDRDSDIYILSNKSNLHNISTIDTELYNTARTTAVTITYYGLCLLNGNYTVILHFAEIVLTQYKSFSLGRRVFDVYVQVIQLLNIIIGNCIKVQPTISFISVHLN
ncbi:putative Malectin domain-containing protein [Helianthus anomalus]